jgi:hypothetical protein
LPQSLCIIHVVHYSRCALFTVEQASVLMAAELFAVVHLALPFRGWVMAAIFKRSG